MRSATSLAALAASPALATYMGFNYGSTFTSSGAVKVQSDFETEFAAAQKLAGTNGAFSSARLYTTIQGSTTSDVIQAIPAAIKTNTTLLLGLWASAGDATFANEITALQGAIKTYGDSLKSLVVGISVGSEDLYRLTDTARIANNETNPGAAPDTLVGYIKKVRDTVKGTALDGVPVGHVDTWDSFTNTSNAAVNAAVDFCGVDAYPWYQKTQNNDVENAQDLFLAAFEAAMGACAGKQTWVTETGWAVNGTDMGKAQASPDNAQKYWDQVGCGSLFGQVNTWWFTLDDSLPDQPNPSFGILNKINGQPQWNLSCEGVQKDVAPTPSASGSRNGTATSTGSGGSSKTGGSSLGGSGSGGSSTGSSSQPSSSQSGVSVVGASLLTVCGAVLGSLFLL